MRRVSAVVFFLFGLFASYNAVGSFVGLVNTPPNETYPVGPVGITMAVLLGGACLIGAQKLWRGAPNPEQSGQVQANVSTGTWPVAPAAGATPRKAPPQKAMVRIDDERCYVYYVPDGTHLGDELEVPWGRPRETWERGTVVAWGSQPTKDYRGRPKAAYTGRCRYARRPGEDVEAGDQGDGAEAVSAGPSSPGTSSRRSR